MIKQLPTALAVTLPLTTVATDELVEDQTIVLSVTLSGYTVAVRVICSPGSIEALCWLNNTFSGLTAVTATEHVSRLPWQSAMMKQSPTALAVTLPLTTVATDELVEDQTIVLSVTLSGYTVAVRVICSPGSIEALCWLNNTFSGLTAVTATEHVSRLPWQSAMMKQSPTALAVTLPLTTVATDELVEDQTTVLSVTLSGYTVAVRVTCSPRRRLTLSWSRATYSGKISFTSTWHIASLSLHAAMISHSPTPRACISPLLTLATFSSVEIHDVNLLVTSSGRITASKTMVLPRLRLTVSIFNEIESGTITNSLSSPESNISINTVKSPTEISPSGSTSK